MNWLDIVIIVIVAVPIAFGFRIGLIHIASSLVAIAAGTLLATLFWRQAADIVGVIIPDDNLAALIGYLLILVGLLAAGWAAAVFAKGVLNVLMMGWLDKVGGIVFGALLGCVIVAAVFWSLESFSGETVQEALDKSLLRPYFAFLVPILRSISGEIDLS
ncbi:MAG: CvpA family protein [Chloroflexi bacterium]|nr:CvpA family protein [Chloroflexota bacterium]